MSETPHELGSSAWIKNESMSDVELLKLIGFRETLLREHSKLLALGQQIPPAMHEEMSDISRRITVRKSRLVELHDQALGDEAYFHILIKADDLRQAAEEKPDDLTIRDQWETVRKEADKYHDEHFTTVLTEEAAGGDYHPRP
jgi:hypothetical protein